MYDAAMFVRISVAIFVFAIGQAATEPPAASRRPNLQVLKTVPESQLFPMMNAIADSLGVNCDYCHVRAPQDPKKPPTVVGGWVWDSDDKEPKRIARDMMRMVLDVNTRQFGGETVVTCFTCHRGSTAPARFPSLPPRDHSFVDPPARALPSTDQVWNAYVRAVGEPASGFRTTVLAATDDRSEGRHGSVEVIFKGSDIRVSLQMPPDASVSQAVRGDTGWVANAAGSRELRPDEIARVRRGALRYRPIKLERPAQWSIVGVERVGSREAYVAVADIDARTKRLWYFDVATGLLLRDRTTTETAFIPLQEQVDYEDYRRVDGVMLPFRMRISDGSPYSTSLRVFTRIKHDVKVEDSVFERKQ
jgi:photosynthetic reaction center cytochrome c subunit